MRDHLWKWTCCAIWLGLGAAHAFSQEEVVVPVRHEYYTPANNCGDGSGPTKVILHMPPPKVEVRRAAVSCDDDDDSRSERRFSIFHHRKAAPKERAAMSSLLLAPASIAPLAIPMASAATTETITQHFSFDMAGLQRAHRAEMEMATLNTHLNLRKAMQHAEDEATQSVLNRAMSHIETSKLSLQPQRAQLGGAGENNLDAALSALNKRLDQLEKLVLEHHQYLLQEKDKAPAKPR